MSLSLYVAPAALTVQGIALGGGDYFTYDPATQLMTAYLDGDGVNPAPVTLPSALLNMLLAQGKVYATPLPFTDNLSPSLVAAT